MKILMKRPSMKGRTLCVILQNLDEAPVNDSIRSLMCDRFIQNAFEGLQNLNFHFFIKFDIPLRNKKLGLYYLQEKNALFQILKTWRVKVTHESIFASKYDF